MNYWLVAEAILNLVAIKFERDLILAKVRELQDAGATPEQLVAALKAMRDEAIQNADDLIG
jgi:flagellar basal body P-ring protein FlgI